MLHVIQIIVKKQFLTYRIFDTIDQTYFSSFALSSEEWTPVGDYQMMDGGVTEDDAYAYGIKVTP